MAAAASKDRHALIRLLYRSLLRVAKRFDARPATRYALHINPTTGPPATWSYYHEAVADFLNNRLYLTPDASGTPVAAIVRRYFRIPDPLRQTTAPSATAVSAARRRQRTRGEGEAEAAAPAGTSVGERLDAAFLALRELSKAWHSVEIALLPHMARASSSLAPGTSNSPSTSSGGDKGRKEEGEAAAPPAAAAAVAAEEEEEGALPFPVKPARSVGPGVLLLAHPMMHDDTFKRAVVYLVEHSRKEGAYGLVVNQLSDMTLPQAVEGGLAPEFFAAFGQNPLRRGGPVPRLQMLHQHERVGGLPLARRGSPVVAGSWGGGGGEGKKGALGGVPPPVFAGGDWKEATKLVRSGATPPEAFLFFCGAATWAPGQLEQEMAKGYWVASQGPPHLALEHRPKLWYELLTALGRRAQHAQHAGAGAAEERKGKGGGRHVNGYWEAAALPEEGLERVEPLAFD